MSDTLPNLGIKNNWALGTYFKAENDANLAKLDAMVQLSVKSRSTTAPPGSPADGDRYIIPVSATGDWSGKDKQIAVRVSSAWSYYAPVQGWSAYVDDEPYIVAIYRSSAWSSWADTSLYETLSHKGAASGYCPLDSNSLVPLANLPAGALPTLKVVADQTARYALTTTDVQNGDTVKQTDTGIMWYVKDQTNLGNSSGYSVYTSWADWSTLTNIPAAISALSGTNTGNETTTTIGTLIHGSTNKATPVGADEFGIWDSVSGLLNRLSLTNLATAIQGLIKGSPSTLYVAVDTYANLVAANALSAYPVDTRLRATNGARFDLIANGTVLVKQPQPDITNPTPAAIVGGLVTIDLHDGYTQTELPLTANVTNWAFSNLPPVSGSFIERNILIIQHASSLKTVATPATTGRTAGIPFVADTTLGSRQVLVLRCYADGTRTLFATPVQV